MPPVKSMGASENGVAGGYSFTREQSAPYSTSRGHSPGSDSMQLLDNLSRPAQSMYMKMMNSKPEGHIYTQGELAGMVGISDPMKLMTLIQENMNMGLVKMLKQGDDLCYQAIKKEEAEKIQSMSKDEAMVYSYIETAGTEGIWTKTIKAKTNLHQTVVQRCLKSLEGKRYIKNVKSVKYPTRKIYMLASLQPSVDVTGGPWFTDSELDTEFISSLLSIIYRFIASESFPGEDEKPLKVPSTSSSLNKTKRRKNAKLSKPSIVYNQLSYPASYSAYPSLSQIHDFVQTSGITTVDLAESDIKSLLDVLVYDGKIEPYNDGLSYKALLDATSDIDGPGGDMGASELDHKWDAFTESPCGHCPVFELCRPDGPVSAAECIYLDEWLVQ
ncbi:RNA polymerase Rpc34 [Dipodascopsis uninucleata]